MFFICMYHHSNTKLATTYADCVSSFKSQMIEELCPWITPAIILSLKKNSLSIMARSDVSKQQDDLWY